MADHVKLEAEEMPPPEAAVQQEHGGGSSERDEQNYAPNSHAAAQREAHQRQLDIAEFNLAQAFGMTAEAAAVGDSPAAEPVGAAAEAVAHDHGGDDHAGPLEPDALQNLLSGLSIPGLDLSNLNLSQLLGAAGVTAAPLGGGADEAAAPPHGDGSNDPAMAPSFDQNDPAAAALYIAQQMVAAGHQQTEAEPRRPRRRITERLRVENRARKRRWREANEERNREADMRTRVLRRATKIFGSEPSATKQEWVEQELEVRRQRRHERDLKMCGVPKRRQAGAAGDEVDGINNALTSLAMNPSILNGLLQRLQSGEGETAGLDFLSRPSEGGTSPPPPPPEVPEAGSGSPHPDGRGYAEGAHEGNEPPAFDANAVSDQILNDPTAMGLLSALTSGVHADYEAAEDGEHEPQADVAEGVQVHDAGSAEAAEPGQEGHMQVQLEQTQPELSEGTQDGVDVSLAVQSLLSQIQRGVFTTAPAAEHERNPAENVDQNDGGDGDDGHGGGSGGYPEYAGEEEPVPVAEQRDQTPAAPRRGRPRGSSTTPRAQSDGAARAAPRAVQRAAVRATPRAPPRPRPGWSPSTAATGDSYRRRETLSRSLGFPPVPAPAR